MKNANYLAICLLIIGCNNQGPREIGIGQDACAHCQMTIVDARFSAQLITTKGKYYPFDDLFCLSTFISESPQIQPGMFQSYVSDFATPDSFIKMEQAFYLYNLNINTPMGGHTAAFGDETICESMFNQMGGERLEEKDVYISVRKSHE